MLALKHFYRELGEKTWGWMGFYDAFNQKRDWWARSYLAIDQGPIILMIENHRTALLWDLFMANPEIQPMMDAIGFYHSPNSVEKAGESQGIHVFPNPASGEFLLSFPTSNRSDVLVELYSSTGEKIRTLLKDEALPPGEHHLPLNGHDLSPGLYFIRLLKHKNESVTTKLIIH